MKKKTIVIFLVATMFLVTAATEVSAQDVLMNSAETIKQGNIKLGLFPTVFFGIYPPWGLAGRAGYGLTPRFDIEAKGAFFKGINYFGVDVEYWILKGGSYNVSAALGGHMVDVADDTIAGIDTALQVSTAPVEFLVLYGGLKFAFDSVKKWDRVLPRAHLVSGLEYRISDTLDFLVEFGFGFNENFLNYASVGLALYILR